MEFRKFTAGVSNYGKNDPDPKSTNYLKEME
jgi:hypothetical protein